MLSIFDTNLKLRKNEQEEKMSKITKRIETFRKITFMQVVKQLLASRQTNNSNFYFRPNY